MNRGRRPSIHQVGSSRVVAGQLQLEGWAIGLCASHCPCHRHPITGALVLQQDPHGHRLGLASFPPCPPAQPPSASAAQPPTPCVCCQPWTVDELLAIVRDLDYLATLQVGPPPAAPHTSS